MGIPSDDARLRVTARARRALARVCAAFGPQAVLLSWPAGAAYLPATTFVPGRYDAIVGHIVRCPIYADVRQLGFYTERSAVLDVRDALGRGRPVLRLRDERGWR